MLLSDMEKAVRSPNVKTTCFGEYRGTDEVKVLRKKHHCLLLEN